MNGNNTIVIDVEERREAAMRYFREGYNCCQSVALAFSDVISGMTGMTDGQVAAVTSGFGGGFARLREVCGCVSGMTFVAGAVSPAKADPGCHGGQGSGEAVPATDAREIRRANYALVQGLAGRFSEENGSIVCRELLGMRSGRRDGPEPSERNERFYGTRPCERLVGSAAAILAERLKTLI